MGTAIVLATVLAAATSVTTGDDVRVTVSGEHVSLRVQNAPLAKVLDRLARETGMKVDYEGPPPAARVSLTLTDRTIADAVAALLEERKIPFTLTFDPTGSRAQRLVVSQRSSGKKPARRPPAQPKATATPVEESTPGPTPSVEEHPRPRAEVTATPGSLPTPDPFVLSPFTPQGQGPIILNIPGATPTY